MSAAPTVSVLIKSYNHARYVARTIESVLTQSFQDFEIVVTDDASTDGTLEVLRGFTDPRIKLTALPRNQGISGAMNATVARARGRYLAILNSDDFALPDRLRRQVAFLDAHPDISLVFGLPVTVDETGMPRPPETDFELPLRLPDFSRRSWLRQLFFSGNCLCSPTAMIRRESYATVGAYDRRLTNLQDVDMWVRMLKAGLRFHVLPDRVTAFRVRDNDVNMSARRIDTVLRTEFEATKVLAHYATFDDALFEEVFGADAAATAGQPMAVRLAELALRVPRHSHLLLALELLYGAARDTEGFHRLRDVAGRVDVFGIVSREQTIAVP